MLYSFEKILKGLKENYKIYLFIFLELVLCFSLTFLGINQMIGHQKRKSLMWDQTYNRLFIENRSPKTLSSKDLQKIEATIQDSEQVIYLQYHPINILLDDTFITLPTYLVNESFIELYLNKESPGKTVYSTNDTFISLLEGDSIHFVDSNLIQVDQDLYLENDKVSIDKVESLKEDRLVSSYNSQLDFDLTEALFWPIDHFGKSLNLEQKMNLELLSVESLNRSRQEIIADMNRVTAYEYNLVDGQVFETYQSGVVALSEMVTVFAFCGIVSLIILLVGIVSLLFIFMSKRKKDMVISRLFGASYWQIYGEFFCEIFLVIMPASLLSGLLVLFLQPSLSSIYFQIEMTSASIGAMVILPFLMCGITLGMIQSEMKRIYNLSVYK